MRSAAPRGDTLGRDAVHRSEEVRQGVTKRLRRRPAIAGLAGRRRRR